MPAIKTFDVVPIHPGFEARIALAFSPAVVTEFDLLNSRLLANFKGKKSDSSPLFTLDSNVDSSLFARTPLDPIDGVDGFVHLQMNLSGTNTALCLGTEVVFDMAAFTSGWRVFTGVWHWPVVSSVTRPAT